MKQFSFNCLMFFISAISMAQQLKVLNEKTKEPIPFATIDFMDGTGVNADEKGVFDLPSRTIDSLKISCIGYKNKTISFKDLRLDSPVFMEQDITALDEVLIRKKLVRVLAHKNGSQLKSMLSNTFVPKDFTYNEVCLTYIPFPEGVSLEKEILIKKILVNTTGLGSKKRRYYPFRVNLYEVSKQYNPPRLKDSLMKGIVSRRKEGRPSLVIIDIANENLKLNKKGIYVSFETLSEEFYPNDTLYKFSKRMKSIEVDNYNRYGAAVKNIPISMDTTSVFSFTLKQSISDKASVNIDEHWKMEKEFIYDLTIEIEY
ncbi:carboxypeptidase-like regulatory domain-containing protein [Mangrovimonas aestuarii]|uniref:carboxypeptidase-like regulatory domain-containing protein n=1 Tax=Mangrovimonas aestuarii TaxID=3018443 RepID=UPI0023783FBC|nr:carboxypeptidase-like regulatory domain-containing protein [Mangrovimonas aestuarii]